MNAEELHAIDPDLVPASDELTTLTSFLDYYRAVMVRKAQGLTQDQMATRLGPSALTIGGLLKHLAVVEDAWFTKRLLGQDDIEPWASVDWEAEPDWDFASAAADDPADLVRVYQEACERSRVAVVDVGDLDAVSILANSRGQYFTMRWILVHMIEETARHAGHADLIRESIDAVVGD